MSKKDIAVDTKCVHFDRCVDLQKKECPKSKVQMNLRNK